MILPKNPVPPGTAFMFDHCVGNKKTWGGHCCCPIFLGAWFQPLEARAETLEIPRQSAEDGIRQVTTDWHYPKAAVLCESESRQCLIRRCKSIVWSNQLSRWGGHVFVPFCLSTAAARDRTLPLFVWHVWHVCKMQKPMFSFDQLGKV